MVPLIDSSMSKKRKSVDGGREDLPRHPTINCILHATGIQHLDFTPLCKIKVSPAAKLLQLHSIRDKRLQELPGSSNHMDNVCAKIPESLAGIDLEITGYH